MSAQSHGPAAGTTVAPITEKSLKETTMCTKWTRAGLLIAVLASASAQADNQKGGADPATKTLPATASDKAKANAFGQQGARSKAAHQAAQAAASQAAHAAASQAQPQP